MSGPDTALPDTALVVDLWRGDAGGGGLVRYRVPVDPGQTILDVLTWVQRHAEPGLAYRFACRVGMCGSCAVMVNGVPRWACRTRAIPVARQGRLEIRPLRHFPVIRDLVVDFEAFFARWRRALGRFAPASPPPDALAVIAPDAPDRQLVDAAIECIGCGICLAACDSVGANPDYLGPAALNRAWAAVNDRRDDTKGHLRAAARDGGAHACHAQGSCCRFCPVGRDPAGAISGLKRHLVVAALKGRL
jgi:fumarate reductase iron-sulfur subunit